MKPKRSCHGCRQRHRRCIKPPLALACNACAELGRDCELGLSRSLQILPWKAKPADGSPAATSAASAASHPQDHVGDASPIQTVYSQPSPASPPQPSIPSPLSHSHHIDRFPASGLLSSREAFLFRTWVDKISLISDATDDARHFAVTVSRLALEHPVLLNGILGLASRFDSLATGAPDLESVRYHGRCIELLISLLGEPAETYNDILLAAVVLSRLYEENDSETDSLTYHLTGTRTLLGHQVITRLAAQGGLAEAACWVHLRQALYVAIVHRQHPIIPLSVYESLTTFRRDDDASCGNKIVYLFARIVLRYFPEPHPEQSPVTERDYTWDILKQDLDDWFQSKPICFEPLYHKAATNSDDGGPFPCIWMASTAATVALQYYYSSMIVINLHHCHSTSTVDFEATKSLRTSEKSITAHLCALMGLALSNDQAMNAWYLPCHMLHLCGYLLQEPRVRDHTIQFLQIVNQRVQWKTGPIIAALREQWAELDGHVGAAGEQMMV